jgi:hypothetical protein
MRRPVFVAVSLLLIPAASFGQGRAAVSVSGGARPSAPVAMAHAAPAPAARVGLSGVTHAPAGAHLVVVNGQIHVRRNALARGTTTIRTNRPRPVISQDQMGTSANFYPTPGLGFDIPHWAATHPQVNSGHGRRPRQFAAFFPFFDGGFLVAPQPIVEDEPYADAQEADYPPQTDVSEPRERPRYRMQPDVVTSVDSAEPQKESEQYVFVRRDGTIIFAVAYTWDKGNLRYVTNEGLRRSVSMDLLDLDATRQFNEQRGLSFRLPA